MALDKQALRLGQRRRLRAADARSAQGGVGAAPEAMRIALYALPLLAACRRVALFDSWPGEVNTAPLAALLRARGVALYLPVTEGRGTTARLRFAPWRDPQMEQKAGQRALPATALDAVVVPGLGFDLQGSRLGRGWGCYDRALADYAGLVVGLAERQHLCAHLPRAPHDQPVHLLVTPWGVRRPAQPS